VSLRWLARLEEGLIAFLLAAMTAISFTQVVARYVFNYSFTWALELTTVLFACLIFLGIPYGVRVGSHIGVDALVKNLGPRAGRVVGCIALACCIAYAAILFAGSWSYVAKMHAVDIMMEDLPVGQWVPRSILVVGFGLLFLRFGELFVRVATGRDQRMALGDEAAEALRLQGEMGERERREARGP
jgi:C4-dicarboxylate transporter DctQ subunit